MQLGLESTVFGFQPSLFVDLLLIVLVETQGDWKVTVTCRPSVVAFVDIILWPEIFVMEIR